MLTEIRLLALRAVHDELVTYSTDHGTWRHAYGWKTPPTTYRWLQAQGLIELLRAPWITADAPVALTAAGHQALADHVAPAAADAA